MSNKLPQEVARVVASDKLDDRYLKTKVYTPADRKKREKGSLYFLVEILNPWHPSSQVGEMIVETMRQEYYRIDERPAACFERALKSVNQKLASLANEGETGWVDNLNGVIAAVVGDRIFLSYTGSAEAYLFRGQKISRITEKEADVDSKYPFIDLTNGHLRLDDRFIIANIDLFDYISLDTLRDVTHEEGSKKTAQYIKDVLSKESQVVASALILKMSQADPESRALPDVFRLDQKEGPSQQKVFKKSKDFYSKAVPFMRKKLIKLGYRVEALVKKTNKFFSSFVLSSSQKTEEEESSEGWDKYTGQSIEKEKESSSAFVSFFKQIGNFVTSLNSWIIIGIIAALLIAVGVGIFYNGKEDKEQSLSEQLTLAQEKIDSAQAKIALHEDEKARDLLISVQEPLSDIEKNPDVASQAENLLEKTQNSLYELNKVQLVESPVNSLKDLNQGQFYTSEICLTVDHAYTINNQFSQIYQVDKSNSQEVTVLPQSAGEAKLMKYHKDDNSLLVLTENNQVYSYDLNENKLSKAELDLSDGEYSDLDTYSGNLYFADGSTGTIWRYREAVTGYSTGQPLIKDNQLSGINSISIDGSIYMLKDDGQLWELYLEELSQLNLADPPRPREDLSNTTHVLVRENANFIMLVDGSNNRILKFNKEDGKYQKQYQFNNEIINFDVRNNSLVVITKDYNIYQTKL